MLHAFVEEVEGLQSASALERAMKDELSSLGFPRFAYVALRVPDSVKVPFALTNYPYEWSQRYIENDYVNDDPIFHRATRSIEPFGWPELRGATSLTYKQRVILDEASEFGLERGAAVPIHGPRGGFALLSFISSENNREFEKQWRDKKLDLHMMALYYHAAIEKNLLVSDTCEQLHLTDREREALLWTARGKTAWETSEIMKISQDTVNFHLKNVMHKVGVYSKHHAVVKAIMMGLIFP